jgi:hypothetical protein
MNRSWTKRLAMLMLLGVALDLSVPGICRTDGIVMPVLQTIASATPANSHQESNPQETFGDDCFCCCSHIVPTAHFRLERGQTVSSEGPPYLQIQPTKLSTSVYHPPRA